MLGSCPELANTSPRAPTPPFCSVIFALFTRLAAPASAVLLAVTAAVSLLHSPRMCVRVLESDGVAPVLGSLHRAMSLVQ